MALPECDVGHPAKHGIESHDRAEEAAEPGDGDNAEHYEAAECIVPVEPGGLDAGTSAVGAAAVERPAQQPLVPVHHWAFAVRGVAFGLEEVSRDHRRDHTRDEQRHGHRCDDGETEVLEELARHARHQADRQEDSDDRSGGGDHRQADFVGGVDRGLVGRLAHSHVSDDVLDLHDRIVDQHARHEAERQQRELVQGETEEVHDPEGRNGRQRDGQRGNEGRAPVTQEEEHHDNRQDRAFDHRRDRAVVLRLGVVDRSEQAGELDARVLFLDFLQLLDRIVIDADVRCAAGAGEAEGHDLATVDLAERADLAEAVAHFGDIGELDCAATADGDLDLRERICGISIAEHADRLA